eukprot:m.255885 g.255885  ORF g.255885 m.255885 type:complete len:67 (+) comp15948_c0_seq9:35-235(+)
MGILRDERLTLACTCFSKEPAPSILDARNFDDTRTMVISGVCYPASLFGGGPLTSFTVTRSAKHTP